MQRFNYPTTIYFGEGSLAALAAALRERGLGKILLVTDKNLLKQPAAAQVTAELTRAGLHFAVFADVHPNPVEEDVEGGVEAYRHHGCDCLVALGGGSPMDAAKVIRLMASHAGPLERYDDAKGGDKLVVNPMPPLFAIPTTAGTGSEVGRSGVIILRATGRKTIFFHPRLMPDIAVLEPSLTAGLPPAITAATGIDALTHCLEAYLAPVFHPMADGIALEGLRLILANLPKAYADGADLAARGNMQMAAAMGATAFQKGLGMVHSLAHPLSARYHTHHGLANALLLPFALEFLEKSKPQGEAAEKLERVAAIFAQAGWARGALSKSVREFFRSVGVEFGLAKQGVPEKDLEGLSQDAIEDSCHATNLVPVRREDMLAVYRSAF